METQNQANNSNNNNNNNKSENGEDWVHVDSTLSSPREGRRQDTPYPVDAMTEALEKVRSDSDVEGPAPVKFSYKKVGKNTWVETAGDRSAPKTDGATLRTWPKDKHLQLVEETAANKENVLHHVDENSVYDRSAPVIEKDLTVKASPRPRLFAEIKTLASAVSAFELISKKADDDSNPFKKGFKKEQLWTCRGIDAHYKETQVFKQPPPPKRRLSQLP